MTLRMLAQETDSLRVGLTITDPEGNSWRIASSSVLDQSPASQKLTEQGYRLWWFSPLPSH